METDKEPGYQSLVTFRTVISNFNGEAERHIWLRGRGNTLYRVTLGYLVFIT